MNQGAWTFDGRFWIDPGGTAHQVTDAWSHEEWARHFMLSSLESLFSKGWHRIQALPRRYLFLDHSLPEVNPAQADTLRDFFFFRGKGLLPIPYVRIVVERDSHDLREFLAGEYQEAYAFACTGNCTSRRE